MDEPIHPRWYQEPLLLGPSLGVGFGLWLSIPQWSSPTPLMSPALPPFLFGLFATFAGAFVTTRRELAEWVIIGYFVFSIVASVSSVVLMSYF